MKFKRLRKIKARSSQIIFWLAISVSSTLKAELISSVDAGVGFTSLSIKSANFSTTLAAPSAVAINYALHHTAFSTAYVMSFYELVRSGEQAFPYSQFSIGPRFFPMGFNGGRVILDQGVAARVMKATPYFGFTVGLANISIPEINASLIEISPNAGIELPVTTSFLVMGQMTFHSASSTGGAAAVSYSGITAMLGLISRGF